MDFELTRRALLGLSGIAMVAPATTFATAFAADTYDSMRGVWVSLLTGSGFDPSVPPYSPALKALGSRGASFRASMAPSTSSLWPDLPIGSVSANVTSSYNRLRGMALAYVQPNTGLTGDAGLATDIKTGLDWLHAHAYTPTTATYNNWWDWQIGTPGHLLDTALLMYSQLSAKQAADYCAAVDHFVPASAVANYTGTSTGANRADLCKVLALRGVLGKSASPISTAQTALSPIFPYVLSGDGLYADGSFVQHTWIPYTGTYGQVLLSSLSKMIALFAGTTWAVTDPQVRNVFTAITSAFAPFIYNGLVMDGVSGRGASRGISAGGSVQSSDHARGHQVVSDILRLATSGAPQGHTWKSMVKGWLRREYYEPLLGDPAVAIPELARAQALVNDTSVTATPEPVGHRLFGMDRAVHRRSAWAAAISMCSSRTAFYEYGNGENLRGWHTNSGMLYWWGNTYGNGQYSDAFWPTVDPYHLPGTTVSTKALADGAGQAWGGDRPHAPWVGGTTDGTFAAVGQDVRGLQSTLAGKKSWFCLEDSIFCLGAAITATDGTGVRTTIDNRNMGPNDTSVFTVDGTAQSGELGWSRSFTNPRYMSLSGVGAWVFPLPGTVTARHIARTGKWSDINTGGSTTPITRTYVTMSVEHGTDPRGASYCYQLMPGATPAQAAARAAAPNVTVLSNSATAQAISVPSLGLTMANFFSAGTAGSITVTKPCSVLVKEQGGTMTVHVADPTRTATTVQVTIASTAYPKVNGTATGITALTTSGRIVLLAEVGGTLGASRTMTLSGTGTTVTPATATHLPATAATYVRDGSYATTNFSNQTTMVVKNTGSTGSGYNRRSLTKFDLTGLGGTVRRAVLWVYGNVQDSGGTHATVQAHALDASWSESAVTWNTAPAMGTAQGAGQLSTRLDWVALDVTNAVAAARASGTVALGVYGPSGLAVVLNTRTNATNPPQLEVVTA
nr:polysaccharide lyase family 8 super-sandwich domain-containing protein [Kibdelosporangium sp. MJ126-NF4]